MAKKSPEKRDKLKTTFGIQKWKKLEFKEKSKHTIYNCPRCQDVNFEHLKLFPVNSIKQKAKFQKMLEKYNLDNATTNKVTELDSIDQNTILHLRKLSKRSYFQLTKAKKKGNSRWKSKKILNIKWSRHL